jgi:hypothetical protein
VWRTFAKRFPYREGKQFAYAHRRRERECRTTVGGDGMEIERHANAYHTCSFGASSRSRLPPGSTVHAMTQLGKHVAKMDEAELASLITSAVDPMAGDVRGALIGSIFDAFRDRGESSEDAAEGAGTHVPLLEANDPQALKALIEYSREHTGLLKEALEIFASEHAAQLGALPQPLLAGVAVPL